MKKKHNMTDEEILQTIKPHLDEAAQQAFYDRHLRNLSVDVLNARTASRRSTVIRWTSLAVGTVGAAALIYLLQPMSTDSDSRPAATTNPANVDVSAQQTHIEAEAYLDALVETESVDLLTEVADADPVLLSDRDVDQLFEGL